MKKILASVFLALLCGTSLRAASIDFPAKDPAFSFTLPDSWSGSFDGTLYSAQPKNDKDFALTFISAPGAQSLEDVIKQTTTSAGSAYTDIKMGDAAAHEVEGMKLLFANGTAKLKGAESKLTMIALTTDGARFFCLFAGGSPAADKAHGPECEALLKSIKAKNAEAKSEDKGKDKDEDDDD